MSLFSSSFAASLGLLLPSLSACAAERAGISTDDEAASTPQETRLDAGRMLDAGKTASTRRSDATAGRTPPSAPPSCEPGSYAGRFMCQIQNLVPWSGEMSFSLVSQQVSGADISYLEIKSGTHIEGMDEVGGMFAARLEGMFDCDTGALTGSLQEGMYTAAFGIAVAMSGDLERIS